MTCKDWCRSRLSPLRAPRPSCVTCRSLVCYYIHICVRALHSPSDAALPLGRWCALMATPNVARLHSPTCALHSPSDIGVRYWPLLMTCMRCYTPPRRRSVLLASPDINRAYLVSILHRVTQEPMSLAPWRSVHSDPAVKRAATSP